MWRVLRDTRKIGLLIRYVEIGGRKTTARAGLSLVSTGVPMTASQRAATAPCPTMHKAVVTVRILFSIVAHFVCTQTHRNGGSNEGRRRKVRSAFSTMLVLPTAQGPRASGACAVHLQVRPFLLRNLLRSQPWVFRLCTVTPNRSLLSSHERHITQLGIGRPRGSAATDIRHRVVSRRVGRGGGR